MGVSLTITNNSGHKIYYLVWGLNDGPQPPAPQPYTAPWCYLDANGHLQPFPTPPLQPGAYYDFTKDIPSMEPGAPPVVFDNLPYIWSGQVFFSFDQPPKLFQIVPSWKDAKKRIPSPDHGGFGVQTPGFNPGDQDANTLFSSSEFTFDPIGMYADTTCVDHFTAPITVSLDGKQFGKQSSGALNAGISRNDVFAAFTGITDPKLSDFKKLIMTNGSTNVRVLAPGHGIEAGLFPATYYDNYVQHCWAIYQNHELTVNIPPGQYQGVYTGKVDGNTLKFPLDTDSQCTILLPPSKDIFLCNGNLLADNDLCGALRARIGAAFNRTVLHNHNQQPYCSDFYSTADESQSWWATNWYSKLLHDCMQKVYSFPFDDVCGNDEINPLLQDSQPISVEFELASWDAN